ncbi:hypothetical protein [Mariniblastus fucicola]|uniref:Lipoprotein n=1 Tax=Mariniblastus fucicola TaxID=980251 RepID=A0A5B9PGW2_9BACT|nr:hypothetical protein [Mariniblastus fucicola]QEG24839.1 hypothetical protein MFFC18_47620 [Mariniblastus fucicola]
MRVTLLLAIAVLLLSGCSPSPEERLGLTYTPPVVPENVPAKFKPEPNTKIETWLKDGETHLNLKEHYVSSYRYGWDEAIYDWTSKTRFTIESRQDAMMHHADIKSGSDAFWLGYSEARRQIESRPE